LELRRVPQALANYQKAHDLFEALVKKAPDNLGLHWYLANTRYGLATAQQSLGKKDTAGELYRACVKDAHGSFEG